MRRFTDAREHCSGRVPDRKKDKRAPLASNNKSVRGGRAPSPHRSAPYACRVPFEEKVLDTSPELGSQIGQLAQSFSPCLVLYRQAIPLLRHAPVELTDLGIAGIGSLGVALDRSAQKVPGADREQGRRSGQVFDQLPGVIVAAEATGAWCGRCGVS